MTTNESSRKAYIQENLQRHWEALQELGYEVVLLAVQGSQNYLTDTYSDIYKSDLDTKAIVLPTIEQIAANKKPVSYTHVLPNEEHIDIKDIREMFRNFKKQNLNFLEILFTDFMIVNPKYQALVDELISIREEIAYYDPKAFVAACTGMCYDEQKRALRETPARKDTIQKYGYSPKSLSQIIRLSLTVEKYIQHESFKQCMEVAGPDYLRRVKEGCYDKDTALKLIAHYLTETTKLYKDFCTQDIAINSDVSKKLDKICLAAIKQFLREELSE